jgi:hypothetical protein
VLASSAETVEYSFDVRSLLHRYNSELVLFVDPDKEGLVLVVEDASAVGPVSVQADGFKESISFFEQEVVINQLLSLSFCQIIQRIVGALEVTVHMGEGLTYFLFNFLPLVICNARSKGVVS